MSSRTIKLTYDVSTSVSDAEIHIIAGDATISVEDEDGFERFRFTGSEALAVADALLFAASRMAKPSGGTP